MSSTLSRIPLDDLPGGLWHAAVASTTELLQIFTFPEFFNSAAFSLARLLDADGAALIVYDGPDHLRYKLFYGLESVNREAVSRFCFPADKGTVGRALATGRYLFTADYANSLDAMPEFAAAGLRANLVFPLPGPAGFVGAVAISWINREPPELAPAALLIGEMFAALIGASLYREELEKRLEGLSLQDPLTGLPNRRMLMVRLAEAQKRAYRNQSLLALAVLDLDGFKRLNDVFGHSEGDRMLVHVATSIKEAVRTTDLVGRLGGDEFVVILEDIKSLREAKTILGRIVKALNVRVEKDGAVAEIFTSIGATLYPPDLVDADTLLHHADEAMYLAKRAGGNRFMIKAG